MARIALLPVGLGLVVLGCSGGGRAVPPDVPSDGRSVEARAGDSGDTSTPPDSCAFPETYRFGSTGALIPWRDVYVLEPPDRFTLRRDVGARVAESCSGSLPACHARGGVSVRDVVERLTAPELRDLWPEEGARLFGLDRTMVDVSVRYVARESGGSLVIGGSCGDRSGCTAVPDEVDELDRVLRRLASQIRSSEACASFGR